MFQSSGTYVDTALNSFDALIVDETHRLNAKSGMFQNKGENQLHEIIKAAKCSIFFIDENQQVTLKDIGTKEEILKHARKENAEVHEAVLSSQFRCNGSDGYLAFLDNLLQIKETAVTSIRELEYDFRIFDNPSELRDLIYEKNKAKNSARLVAGYCWDWISKKNPKLKDIVFPETDFAMKWNLNEDTMLWIMKPDSVEEVGCIHTCQGLELDYVGVIIGMDMICRNSEILVDPSKRSKMDSSIKGYKTLLKLNEHEAKKRIKQLIKNTYRTLMTRGMKGCYVYCEDKELKEWFQNNLI